jgi:aconitate hydratase
LGIRAVVAKSFARIHRTNLVTQGILPLVFTDGADYEHVTVGERWTIEGARDAVAAGERDLSARTDDGRTMRLRATLSAREREILLAGGLRNLVRAGGLELRAP